MEGWRGMPRGATKRAQANKLTLTCEGMGVGLNEGLNEGTWLGICLVGM